MIIFFNKKTKEVVGQIEGRVHPPQVLAVEISMKGTKESDIGKYVVPFKAKYVMAEEPKIAYKLIDEKKKLFEKVKVGTKKVKIGAGMTPDVPFANLILDFESGKKDIRNYKVKLKKGEVVGFMLK